MHTQGVKAMHNCTKADTTQGEAWLQSDNFGWVGLDCLTDRRGCRSKQKMAVILATTTQERDADSGQLLGRENTWCRLEGLYGFDRLLRRVDSDGAHESLESTGRGRVARTTTMESC